MSYTSTTNTMSLDSDRVGPNQADMYHRSATSTSTNELPSTSSPSQVTVVHQPRRPEPSSREPSSHELQSTSSAPSWQMNAVPHAPSPPEAPTFPSCSSEEETYSPETHSAYRPISHEFRDYSDFPKPPSNASMTSLATPKPPPAVHFNTAPVLVGGMHSDSLVNRDFKDDLARAAGAVTPGVNDSPYILYAIEALTRQHREQEQRKEDPRTAYGYRKTRSRSDEPSLPQTQVIPQFSVQVSQPESARQSLPVAYSGGEPTSASWRSPSPASTIQDIHQAPIDHYQPAVNLARQPERPRPESAHLNDVPDNSKRARALAEQPVPASVNNHSPPRNVDVWRAQSDSIPKHDLEALGYRHTAPPPLSHKPRALRTPSLLLFMVLCILLIVALIFSAVYSIGRDGFTPYAGSIYGGQYFVFRVLPQLIGAVLLIYAQCIVAAVSRIFPFSAMASDDRRERRNAVFIPMYPKSFLWPQLFGPWQVWVPCLIVWLMNFTIPLLSSLYTVALVNGVWTWSTVQGVAWTLVAVYVSLLLSMVVALVYWRHRRTGMMETWDVKSIADIIFLVSQSNSLPQYRGLETAATRGKMERSLDGTAERLGYWTTPEVPENSIFWGFGVPTTEDDLEQEKWDKTNWATQRDLARPVTISDVEDQREPWTKRHRYLPWCFRDIPILSFVAAGTVLYIILLVVSFLPSTDIRDGFLPHLSAAPLPGSFSPADFLYSFIPSLIGLALFLGFQSLELTLRILAPWGELARMEGSRAETSLLLDYTACLPWQSTFKALKLRHWRVAFITFLSPLFVLLPVLGGGLFMALTPSSGTVRIYPNIPILALILTLLFLYLAALVSLIPSRAQFRLPHGVTCLAEIMSFCCNEQLRTDEAFDQMKTNKRIQLEYALDCGKDWHRQGRWTFGAGLNNQERLGIKRYSKFTVNPVKVRQYDKHVRGKSISGPLPHGSGPLFGRY
ncbi:hypothetical protein F4808DRAFT_415353 [Astrocystis sublimbata]|nr:hypothetical protein F4808DRAFT_415353 [Astrocystis sublimbata]